MQHPQFDEPTISREVPRHVTGHDRGWIDMMRIGDELRGEFATEHGCERGDVEISSYTDIAKNCLVLVASFAPRGVS